MESVDWWTVGPAFGSVAMAVLGGVGAGISWWRSNLSTNARDAARAAEKRTADAEGRAEKILTESRRMADSLEKVAAALSPGGSPADGSTVAEVWNRTLATARRASAGAVRLASVVPALHLQWTSKSSFSISNTGDSAVRCVRVLNRNEFVKLTLPDGFELQPGAGKSGVAIGAMQLPLPDNLILEIEGRGASVYLSLAGRPR